MGDQEILLSTIFNESFDAMMILDLSTQKFIMFNKKTLEIYNYSEEEFKQITPKELTLEFVSDEKMKEKQKTILDRGWDKFTTKHKTKDGKAIDVLIKSKKIELIKDVPLLYITIHNLEKEKELEKEFETIFNNTKDGIATIDFEGKLLKFNNSFKLLSEYNYNELINLSFLDLIPHSNKRKIKEAIKEVIKNNFIENFETIYLTKNNKSIVIYMTMNLMPNQKQILLIVKNFTFIKLIHNLINDNDIGIPMTVLTFPTEMTHNDATHTPTRPTQSLLSLPKQQLAYVTAIIDNPAFGLQDGLVSRRLHDLGFLPNTAIKIVAKGLFGRPPFAVQLAGGAQFSLRRDELAKIKCQLV